MPTIVGGRDPITDYETMRGHIKGLCYGAKEWDTSDGEEMGSGFYLVREEEMLDEDGELVAEGWWCENCCRRRGWIW